MVSDSDCIKAVGEENLTALHGWPIPIGLTIVFSSTSFEILGRNKPSDMGRRLSLRPISLIQRRRKLLNLKERWYATAQT